MVKRDGKLIYLVNVARVVEWEDINLTEIGKQDYKDIALIKKVILVLGQTGVGKTT